MADPTKYTPGYDFSDFQATLPNKPLPGAQIDVELADISTALGGAIDALKDVRRSDGKIQNGAVSADSLDDTLVSAIAADVLVALGDEAIDAVQEALPQWRGSWVTATAYDVNDLARQSGSTYICMAAHVAGVFSTDLAAGRWEMFAQQGSAGVGTGDMLAANNLSDVADAATARANLGVAASSATLLKADNLSGLANVSTARANLGGTATGVAVFTAADAAAARTAISAQAADADLTALAGLSANGLVCRTSDGAMSVRTIAGTTDQITVTNGGGVSGPPSIAAVIASQAEAEAGVNTTKLMTAERVAQAILALSSPQESAIVSCTGTLATISGVPAWANRIELLLNAPEANNNAASIFVRLGTASGLVATGYVGYSQNLLVGATADATGVLIVQNLNGQRGAIGTLTINRYDGDIWFVSGGIGHDNAGGASVVGYRVDIGGDLTQIGVLPNSTYSFTGGEVRARYYL